MAKKKMRRRIKNGGTGFGNRQHQMSLVKRTGNTPTFDSAADLRMFVGAVVADAKGERGPS